MTWFDKDLSKIKSLLQEASGLLSDLKDAQEEKNDNFPESLRETESYERMEARFETFDEAFDNLDEVLSAL